MVENMNDIEKKRYIDEQFKKMEDHDYTFNFNSLKHEIENDPLNEYISWEKDYLKKLDTNNININVKIESAEICIYCRDAGENKLFGSLNKLLNHLITCKHNPKNIKNMNIISFVCTHCNIDMGNSYNLNMHENKCELNPLNKTLQFIKDRQCLHCNRTFKTIINKDLHQDVCKANPIFIDKFKCIHCNKHMGNLNNKIMHEDKCDSNPENLNKCIYCMKIFKCLSNKTIHENSECQLNPSICKIYQCMYCTKNMGNIYNKGLHELKCEYNPSVIEFNKNKINIKVDKYTEDLEKLTCNGCKRFCKHQKLYDLHIKSCEKYKKRLLEMSENRIDEVLDFNNISDIDLQILLDNTFEKL